VNRYRSIRDTETEFISIVLWPVLCCSSCIESPITLQQDKAYQDKLALPDEDAVAIPRHQRIQIHHLVCVSKTHPNVTPSESNLRTNFSLCTIIQTKVTKATTSATLNALPRILPITLSLT
jgi:hypothetical protein